MLLSPVAIIFIGISSEMWNFFVTVSTLGLVISGVDRILSTTIGVDLGDLKKGNYRANVTGVINGMGSLGAASG